MTKASKIIGWKLSWLDSLYTHTHLMSIQYCQYQIFSTSPTPSLNQSLFPKAVHLNKYTKSQPIIIECRDLYGMNSNNSRLPSRCWKTTFCCFPITWECQCAVWFSHANSIFFRCSRFCVNADWDRGFDSINRRKHYAHPHMRAMCDDVSQEPTCVGTCSPWPLKWLAFIMNEHICLLLPFTPHRMTNCVRTDSAQLTGWAALSLWDKYSQMIQCRLPPVGCPCNAHFEVLRGSMLGQTCKKCINWLPVSNWHTDFMVPCHCCMCVSISFSPIHTHFPKLK